jgi:hypothetical protein
MYTPLKYPQLTIFPAKISNLKFQISEFRLALGIADLKSEI